MDTIHSDIFPDGTPVDGWFHNTSIPELTKLGKQYIITDYGIHDDGRIYTDNFQKLIDLVYNAGGGVIVIPHGTYMTGALFFRQGVNLYIEDDATLMGSDDISDYPVCETRIEGETCQYFTALINASGIDGFTLCGNGTMESLLAAKNLESRLHQQRRTACKAYLYVRLYQCYCCRIAHL